MTVPLSKSSIIPVYTSSCVWLMFFFARFDSELTWVDRAERNVITFFEAFDDSVVCFYIIISKNMVILVA